MWENVHYPPMTPDMPPIAERGFRMGDWWGCTAWLVCAPIPDGLSLDTVDANQKFLAMLEERFPDRISAELLPARFSHDGTATKAGVPIGADARFWADPLFLRYCEATSELDEWMFIPDFGAVQRSDAGVLVGVRAGRPVASVAPINYEAQRREVESRCANG